MTKIKPQTQTRESAELVLNKFLKKNGILLALGQAPVSTTTDGMAVVGKPNILALYEDQVNKKTNNIDGEK